ncbi:phage tail protein I [Kiloniella laminariae]|uniref:Phage tail protein I n=1 Tax=Kiloniella laminariae TaxID=454162 RepID=A0ABT4LL74_9PROT|nr:phage tail protein I [Kiloniella laminariae]MCZ4281700.1 phage tail protein I [Kiloniella laminariae]
MTSLLPPNATATERAVEAATIRINDIPVPIADLWDPLRCPAEILPFLAWAWSVDSWDASWSLAIKRKVVATAIKVHRHKGTPGAVQDALDALEVGASISEWFNYGGQPYHFRIDVNVTTHGLTARDLQTIEAVALGTKNTRSRLDRLQIFLTSEGNVPYLGLVPFGGQDITIFPPAPGDLITLGTVPFIAQASYSAAITTIHPKA